MMSNGRLNFINSVKKKKKSFNFPKFKNIADLAQACGMGSQNKNKETTRFTFPSHRQSAIFYWLLILWCPLKKRQNRYYQTYFVHWENHTTKDLINTLNGLLSECRT